MIFIDGSNIFHGTRSYKEQIQGDFKIDYTKLVQHVLKGRTLIRSMYFCSSPVANINPSQLKFHEYLRHCNVQVVERKLKQRQKTDGSVFDIEKGVDVALATELIGMAWENAYDVAVLVSGDGDYEGAVKRVMQKGKNVEVVAFRNSCSKDLKDAAIQVTYIEDIASLVKKV